MTEQADTEAMESASQRSREGLISALIAYTFWGLLPIYFILVKGVESWEVLAHRIIWAVPFGALIIHFRGQWPEVRRAFANKKMLAYLTLSALVIGVNWFVYIIAVQQEQIFQASLGYYMNPLFFALVGLYLFGEKLRRPQVIAIVLAGIGVAVLTISGGSFPLIAITLGTMFTIYAVIRKKVVIGGMPGLFVETIVLLPMGAVYLAWILNSGAAVFLAGDPGMSFLLTLAGPFTVIPLLFFALAARRLNLITVGMLQYLAPTLQFIVGLVYGEQLTVPHIICFAFIWAAVALFSWDAWRTANQLSPA